ncbi:MAG: DNA cytosine methyltransferase [Planctomycetota bacterium]|nr:DNA cytosine methyltransferase [Planctomycetota bacterium]
MTAISLFTSGGIGDLAVRGCGFEILVSNEILEDRHAVFEHNFPNATAITGDIWKMADSIEVETIRRLQGRPLTLFYATPPCQGMSKNGRGKLLSEIRAGRKPNMDERNRLIVPTIRLAKKLQPEIVLLENVPEMADTLIIGESDKPINVIDFIREGLGSGYHGRAEIVEFADYGVPQCRQRLITIFSRSPGLVDWILNHDTLMPKRTHSRNGQNGTKKWVPVGKVISDLPKLDARNERLSKSKIEYHCVPVLDKMKYWWVSNTPPERTAFDNQCEKCGFAGNLEHTARHDKHGINRASRETPLFCQQCGEMLPRPSVERDGKFSLMKGFTSAYKRMSAERPASALTRNLSYACSDNKLHPSQNRVLSLFEAFRIHTVDQFEYKWARNDGKNVSDKTVREIIGESIPPAGFKAIVEHVLRIHSGKWSHFEFSDSLFSVFANGYQRTVVPMI